jgi:hypothetical protein
MPKDPHFGPVIVFGLAGIMVEILKDVFPEIAPLAKKDAREMIWDIEGHLWLRGTGVGHRRMLPASRT